MKKFFILLTLVFLSACSTEYILMDEKNNPVREGRYTENAGYDEDMMAENNDLEVNYRGEEKISANDVFVVREGADFVTYQYKNVRVDEISPLASLYCADVSYEASPYLREVSLFHNGFMRATFDCVNVAI